MPPQPTHRRTRPLGRDRRTQEQQKELILRVCDMFLEQKMAVKKIYEVLKREGVAIHREAIYPMFARARELGYLRLVPEFDKEAAGEIAKKYKCAPNSIRVAANTTGRWSGSYVTAAAADVVMELMEQFGSGPVNLGLGPGRATLDFSRQLAQRLQSHTTAPQLKLHAITAGAPAIYPEYAPISFFNVFPQDQIVGCVGLFAETLVTSQDFELMKQSETRVGISEAFQARDEIDIVVTSMGDMHEHDWYLEFLPESDREKLNRKACVGNVQYRPYTAKGPYHEEPDEKRVVTLFELEDFVQMSNSRHSQKHVVLLVRCCPECGLSRASALRPLLRVPQLRVWSRLVLDGATAKELLRDE